MAEVGAKAERQMAVVEARKIDVLVVGHGHRQPDEIGADRQFVTDTIPLSTEAKACPRIRQISIAELLAETIMRISNESSVSSLFME